MQKPSDRTALLARAESHAALLEAAASLMELDGMGMDPQQGHVHHLRCMAGAIRAQAALGSLPQRYVGTRYLPAPGLLAGTEPPAPGLRH
jgi:hypothetical protein